MLLHRKEHTHKLEAFCNRNTRHKGLLVVELLTCHVQQLGEEETQIENGERESEDSY